MLNDSFTGYRIPGCQLLCSRHLEDGDFYLLLLLLRCVMSGLPWQSFLSIDCDIFFGSVFCSHTMSWIYFYLSCLVFIYDPKFLGIL